MLNTNVLVCDNSISGDLFEIITNNSDDDRVENDGNLYLRNYFPPKQAETNFDYCIIYNGLNRGVQPYNLDFDVVYVETSISKIEVKRTKDAYRAMGKNVAAIEPTLVMVDSVVNKVSVGLLAEELEITFENGYMLPFLESELTKYQLLTRNNSTRMKGMSKDFTTMFREQMTLIFDLDKKILDKLMKKM